MSTHPEDSTPKSKKAALKVGGEFGGIAGIVVVGGVVAVGIAAVAISYLRQRHKFNNKTQHPNHDEETVENSGEICSESKSNEFCRGKEVTLAEPSSENAEEIEPPVEIIENFSDMDFSVGWMDTNKSKDEESPRSHFSVGASTSIGSDFEELLENPQNNYRRDSGIDSSHMNLKEGNFNFTSMEETARKDFSHFRESVPDNEECITAVKQLMDPKIEYEESVDSFDGLEEECEVPGRFVESESSVEEQIGEKRLAVLEDCEGNESGRCDLDYKEAYVTERGNVFHNGDREHAMVGLEDDGRSLCFEQFCVPFEGTDAEESKDSQRKHMPNKEIVGVQVSEFPKEDLCQEGDGPRERADSEQDIALLTEKRFKEKISSSDGLNCEEEEYSQDVIHLKNSEDYNGGVGHCDEKSQHEELEESEENFCPIKDQTQRETVLYEELECVEIDVHVPQKGHENEIVGANEEERLPKEKCIQEKFEMDIGQHLQERTESAEEQKDCMVDEAHKGEHVHQEGCENEIDGANEEECLCKEQCLQEEKFETDVRQYLQGRTESEEEQNDCMVGEAHKGEHVYREGQEIGIVGENEEERLRKEQCLQEEKFETDVGQYLQERTELEEDQKDCMVDEAHKGEHVHHEGHENERVCANEEEHLHKEKCIQEDNFETDAGQYLQERTESEEEQKDCMVDEAYKGEHVHREGCENEIAGTNEEEFVCKEQCLQEEKFETDVGQCLQEMTESEEQNECVVHEANKFEHIYHEGQENGMDGENEEEHLCKEQCLQQEKFETDVGQYLQDRTELEEQKDCMEDEPHKGEHVHHEGHENEIVGANEEEHLQKEKCIQEEKFETDVGQYLQERTESEELKDCMVDEAHKGEHVHHEGCENEIVGANEEECLHKEQCLQEGKLKTNVGQYLQERTESDKEQKDCMVDKVHKGEHVHHEGCENEIVSANEEDCPHKEQCLQEEKFETDVGQYLQERTESEEEQKDWMADEVHKGEQCQNGTVDSRDFESLDYKEGVGHRDEIDKHRELEDSEENSCHIKEQCQNETAQCKELECTEVNVHVHQDGILNEIVGAHEKVLLGKTKWLQDEKFECYEGQCLQERTELEELENWRVDVAHPGEQYLFGTVVSGHFVGLDEGNSHENGIHQYGALDSKDFEGVDEGALHENGLCLYGAVDTRGLEVSKDCLNFGEGQIEKEMVNSKEYIDLDIASKEKLLLQEENFKESSEGIEDLSKMSVLCEENTIYLNEIEGVEGNALIFKEQCQEELFDSKESHNSVQGVLLENEGCKEIIGESEELDLTEEDMPIIQEQCQQETVDPIDIQDAVEDVPVKNKQCQREISESEELDDVPFTGEEDQEIAVDSEELILSEDVHSSNEPCQLDMVDPIEKNEPFQQDMVDPIEKNEPFQQDMVDPKENIDGRESEYPSGNALILKELCLNENGGPESSDNEDPRTNNKPEGVDSKESECSSGDTLCVKEEYLQEAVDKAATEDCKEDPEEIEGVHAKKSQHSSTLTYNDKKEVNQVKTTTSVSQSCKLVGVIKGIQENGYDPLHSLKLGSRFAEGKSLWMQPHRHLPMRITIMVSLFALCGFLFLFASKLAKISTSRYAI